jgi:hypothetical protein
MAALNGLLAFAAPTAGSAGTSPAVAAQAAPRPTESQVVAALAQLEADPNLGGSKQTRRLRWAGSDAPRSARTVPAWLSSLFAWLAATARALLWVAGILLVALLGLYLKGIVKARGERAKVVDLTAPSHVRDLDIRPQSLPADIGGAALDSWQRGEHRLALALLYRGLLSRLAHRHAVPIRDSTTEGVVLELAARYLPVERSAYVAKLIRAWQHAVYGGIDPTSEEMHLLCSEFSAALAVASSGPATEQAA